MAITCRPRSRLPNLTVPAEPVSLDQAVAQYEKDILQDVLKTTGGNRAQAARLLHTSERVIDYKTKNIKLTAAVFDPGSRKSFGAPLVLQRVG